MEKLNWVKGDCAVVRGDDICGNHSFAEASFCRHSKSLRTCQPSSERVRSASSPAGIRADPGVSPHRLPHWLPLQHVLRLFFFFFFKDIYFLWLGIHVHEPFGFAESLPLHFGGLGVGWAQRGAAQHLQQRLPGAADPNVTHNGDLRRETPFSVEDNQQIPYGHNENQIISYSIRATLISTVKQLKFPPAHFGPVGCVVSKSFTPRPWGEHKGKKKKKAKPTKP